MSGYARISAVVSALILSSCSSVPQSSPAQAPIALPAPTASQPYGKDARRAAVAAASGRSLTDTSFLATETSLAGLAAKIVLKGTTRPWLCIANPEGVVQNISYMGEE